jgi:hypothetical protein
MGEFVIAACWEFMVIATSASCCFSTSGVARQFEEGRGGNPHSVMKASMKRTSAQET